MSGRFFYVIPGTGKDSFLTSRIHPLEPGF